MELKLISKLLTRFWFCKMSYNGFGLGEVAEPELKQNYKTLKLKTND